MKEFDIKIKETLEKTVTVEAENRQDAEEMVRQAYFDGEHILDADNFLEVDFSVDAEREVQLENQEKLNVLLVKPGMYPQQVQIDPGLAALQQAVEGDIEAAYVAELPTNPHVSQDAMLEGLYTKFNLDHPEDFRGHSLSVSDIVALKTDSVVSYHYVDSIGFKELHGFMPDNYLRNAEMGLEDDYGMIDGVINNGKKEEPPSVLEQLKAKPPERDRPAKPAREKEVERE